MNETMLPMWKNVSLFHTPSTGRHKEKELGREKIRRPTPGARKRKKRRKIKRKQIS